MFRSRAGARTLDRVREVSCKATAVLLDTVEALGISAADVLDGLELDEAHLHDPRMGLEWREFARIAQAIHALSSSDDAFMERVGEQIILTPRHNFAMEIAGHLFSCRQLYRAALWSFSPQLFPVARTRARDRSDGGLEVSLWIDDDLAPCAPFFRLCGGVLRALPRLLGLPHARLEMEVTSHRGRYGIRVPRQRSWLRRARQAARVLTSAPRLGEVLAREAQATHDNYQSLIRAHDDFYRLLRGFGEGVVVHRGGVVLWTNDAFLSATGPRSLLRGERLDVVLPALAPLDGTTFPCTVEHRRADESAVLLELTEQAKVPFDGEPAEVLTVRDVTEASQLRTQLAQADRMASLGTLAAGVAHELNNPLTYSLMNLEVLQVELATDGDDAAQRRRGEVLGAVLEGMTRVRTLAEDLRTFSRTDRPEEGNTAARVGDVLDSSIRMVRGRLGPESRISREGSCAGMSVVGSDARLGQVLLNLLTNAADATAAREGGGEIRVVCSRRADHAVIEIHDGGLGMSPEVLARAFDPFFTTKPAARGTGLGLAISRQIARALGGSLDARSTPGEGSCFTLTLPLAPTPSAEADAPPRPTFSRAGRILLVEDEEKLRTTLATALRRHHTVETARSGHEALERLRSDPRFDAVVCDLMMDDGTGMTVYAGLGSDPLRERLIMMTGGAYTAEAREFLEVTDCICLHKPFELDELRSALDAIIASPPAVV